MALTDEGNGTGMVMPVAPMYGGGYGGQGGFGSAGIGRGSCSCSFSAEVGAALAASVAAWAVCSVQV